MIDETLNKLFGPVFYPILSPVFAPINAFLSGYYQPYATLFALAMFIGTMIWIGAFLNSRYVNRGCPHKGIWSDLRIWTVLSMLPHVLVYLYFR